MGKKVTNNSSEMKNKLIELAEELRADFVEWMNNRLKSCDDYGSYLCNLEDAVKDVNNIVLPEVEPLLKAAKSEYEKKELKDAKATLNKVAVIDNYLGKLQLFVALGDSLYALTLIDMIQRLLDTQKYVLKKAKLNIVDMRGTYGKSKSAFAHLKDYVSEFCEVDDLICLSGEHWENWANMIRSTIAKGDLHKMDGMDDLLKFMKDEDEFIRHAIKSSYFFEPKMVKDQIIEPESSEEFWKARLTTDLNIINEEDLKELEKWKKKKEGEQPTCRYTFGGKVFNVLVDSDGNNFVRQLINDYTAVVISNGKNSLIQNTIISHIWGRAYDPRYFTSLWNIVLIPAWANSLMDKDDAPKGTLASRLRATIMTLCRKMYCGKTDMVVYPEDCLPGNYLLRIIHPKPSPSSIIITKEYWEITKEDAQK